MNSTMVMMDKEFMMLKLTCILTTKIDIMLAFETERWSDGTR